MPPTHFLLFPVSPVSVDTKFYVFIQHLLIDASFFVFLFPVYYACVLLIAFCALCRLSIWSGFSLEILLAFLLLVNVLIFQYLIPAL